jgi:hypothetical protein
MALWCRNMPTVTVPPGDTPKAVTLVIPYYQNPLFLRQQVAGWDTYASLVRPHVSVIVVDDGSPEPATLPADAPLPMRLFRIGVDVRWNWLAARNIGMHHAADGWCLLTDMDHVVPAETMRAVVYGRHDPSVIYAFSRQEHTGAAAAPHSASFLMTREMFWRVGGYDEALSGHYGTDGDWRRRCAAVAPMHVLSDVLIRHEYQQDSSTTRYKRKQPEDAAVRGIIAKRSKGWKPKTLSFPYQEVLQEAACL